MNKACFSKYLVAVITALALPLMAAKAGLRFDGKNDSLTVAKLDTNGFTALTVTMWVHGEYKPGNLLNGPVVLVHFLSGPYGVYLTGWYGAVSGYLNWDIDISASGRWQYLTAVWSNPSVGDGKLKLYVDGIRQESTLAFAGGTNGVLPVGYGVFCGFFNDYIGPFQGELEDVRIYNRALTENEILTVYAGAGADGVTNGLSLWYPMKDRDTELKMEGNNGVLQDRSGKGNHGQLRGAPVWKTAGDSPAEKNKRKRIAVAREWLSRQKTMCEGRRRALTTLLDEHPEIAAKWRGRFEELNRRFDLIATNEICWTLDLSREYNAILAEAGLAALFQP